MITFFDDFTCMKDFKLREPCEDIVLNCSMLGIGSIIDFYVVHQHM